MHIKKEIEDHLLPLLDDHYLFSDLQLLFTGDFIEMIIPKENIKGTVKQFNSELDQMSDKFLIEHSESSESYVLYLNKEIILDDLKCQESFEIKQHKDEQVVAIDMSSPNVGKPMSYQHFRSTIIGNIIANTYDKKGFKTVKINHIGDWGLPLSSIILAIHKWGNIKAIEENPTKELDELYQLYINNLQINPYLEEETLQVFRQLTLKEGKVFETWVWLKDLSMKLFNKIYDTFGITFDSIKGESSYTDYNDQMIKMIEQNNKAIKKHHSLYLMIDDQEVLIQDIDGYSTYLTRDLAAAHYRYNEYGFDKAIYIIGKEQSEHFIKLKRILKQLNCDWYQSIQHIGYSPVMIETIDKEIPNREQMAILNIVGQFKTYIKQQLCVDTITAEKLAVNSLIYETLDHYRDEIITIDIDNFDDLLNNKALHLIKLLHVLKQFKLSCDLDETTNLIEDTEQNFRLLWHLRGFDLTVDQFLSNYDSVVLTNYLGKLFEITHNYINLNDLHDKIDLKSADYNVVQLVIKVIEDSFELMGLSIINDL